MKCLFVCFIFAVWFLSAGCQNPNAKKKSELRCIYDQSVFTESCLKAISNEEFFASFKRDPFYSLLYQGYSFEEGVGFLRAIESEHPSLIAHFDAFRSSDAIGNPRTYDYGKHGIF